MIVFRTQAFGSQLLKASDAIIIELMVQSQRKHNFRHKHESRSFSPLVTHLKLKKDAVGRSGSKVLIWRVDVTKSLTALPGVAFVVGNKRRGAELGTRATLTTEGRRRRLSLHRLQTCGHNNFRPVSDETEAVTIWEEGRGGHNFKQPNRAEQSRRHHGVVAML